MKLVLAASFSWRALIGELAAARSEDAPRLRCPQLLGLVITSRGRNVDMSGAPARIRTSDLCLRRAALYPLSYERAPSRLTSDKRDWCLVPKVRFELTRG